MPEAMNNTENLLIKAVKGILLRLTGTGLGLFISAGSVNFIRGWLWLLAFFIPVFMITFYISKYDRHLLKRRLSGKEIYREQKYIMTAMTGIAAAAILAAGLDFRYGWSNIPFFLSLAADLAVIAGLGVIFTVFKTNTHTANIIAVEKNHKVVSSGFYKYIRHPMYLGDVLITTFSPIALGSYLLYPIIILLLPLLILRILHEEKVLKENLPGYKEYCNKVQFRLIPGIW